jgi:hypothetical protein
MRLRRHLRPAVALIAAYMLAAHAVLLVATPLVGATAGERPICRSNAGTAGAPVVPAGGLQDCLAACLAACCGAGAATPARFGVAAEYPAGTVRPIAFAPDLRPVLRMAAAGVHYSRAPPAG